MVQYMESDLDFGLSLLQREVFKHPGILSLGFRPHDKILREDTPPS